MTPNDLPPQAAEALPPLPDSMQSRIEHLFRGARRLGLIHPLQPILQRYRADVPAGVTDPAAP